MVSKKRDRHFNAYVVSIQLDPATKTRLDSLAKQLGFSRSRTVKMLIVSAKLSRQNPSENDIK